jgi:hypothetical protein
MFNQHLLPKVLSSGVILLTLFAAGCSTSSTKNNLAPSLPASKSLPPSPTAMPFPTRTGTLPASPAPTQFSASTSTLQPSPTSTQTPAPISTGLPSFPLESSLTFTRTAQLGGSVHGITMVGHIAYIGSGPRVAAIDLSQLDASRLVGQSPPLPGQVANLLSFPAAPNPMLLASAGKYLVGLDASETGSLAPTHQIALPGAISAMVLDVDKGILYAGGSIYQGPYQYSGFIAAIDVSPGDGPRILDLIPLPERPISIALGRGVVYAGTEGPTAVLFAARLKAGSKLSPAIRLAGSSDSPAYSMQVIGERLYVGAYGVQAYDVQDPNQAAQAWKVDTSGGQVMGFTIIGDQIYTFGWVGAGTYIPFRLGVALPEAASGPPVGEVASTVAYYDGKFLVAYNDLEVYDPRDPQDFRLVGTYQPPVTSALGIAATESAVYVVDNGTSDSQSQARLRAFSLPDLKPLGQAATRYLDDWGWFRGLAIEGMRAYLAAYDGVEVYDLSRSVPAPLGKPVVVDGQLDAIAALRIGNHRLLVVSKQVGELAESSVLTAYDLTNLQKPTQVGDPLVLSGGVYRMAWSGSDLYAISSAISEDQSDQLFTIAFHEDALALQGALGLPGRAFSLAVAGERVALAGADGLLLVSVANPASPQLLAQARLPELGVQTAILGDTVLVVAGGEEGATQLLVFDIRDPANPKQAEALDVALKDSLVGPLPANDAYLVLASGSLSGVDVLEYCGQK